jgi:4-diphosphocytidyl-2-C-methyl-D-erythritol kinase
VRVAAPAKVNLFLGVGERLPDGYHRVDTVLHAVELSDEIELGPSTELRLTCSVDLSIPAEKNLVCRAVNAMAQAFDRPAAVDIVLHKRIPHGAGLGGGSSDAAATIAGLAELWGLPGADARLVEVARSLGADVPFFLLDSPALMTGRGDVLERPLPAANSPLVLVRPPAGVPTAAAYRAFDEAPAPLSSPQPVIDALQSSDTQVLARALANNMQNASSAVVPEVGETLAWVRQQDGVLGALVAGSGSAVFGLTENDQAAEKIVVEAAARGWWGTATRLRPRGVEVIGREGI